MMLDVAPSGDHQRRRVITASQNGGVGDFG
jgi:hypothetical protein